MPNFYTDHPEIKFSLESSPLMQRIVELQENGYADKDSFDYVLDVLEVAGNITANTIFPNSDCEPKATRLNESCWRPLTT